MAHLIMQHDSMFSVRQVPWHGLGKILEEAPDSVAAIKQAGLDWTLDKTPIHLPNGRVIPDYFANVRSDTQESLGIVTGRYSIVQNREAFAFTDALVGSGDVVYETAGSLRNGRTVWMLARVRSAEDFNLLGDEMETFLCFTNTHDGTGSVRVMVTPVRVVCQNTLNLAIKQAKRAWSTTHVGDIQAKFKEAERTLKQTHEYLGGLQQVAEQAVQIRITATRYAEIMEELLPLKGDESARQKATIETKRNGILECLRAPDITKYAGTGFALINAVSDYVSHTEPMRNTATFQENRFADAISGSTLLDSVTSLVLQTA